MCTAGKRAAWLLLCLALLLPGCGRAEEGRIANRSAAVASIRRGLREHARTITVSFDAGTEEFEALNSLMDGLVEEALEETGEAREGDYIRYQYGGYSRSTSIAGGAIPRFLRRITSAIFRRRNRRRRRLSGCCGSFLFLPIPRTGKSSIPFMTGCAKT